MKQFFSVLLSVILSLLGINSAPYDLEPLPENEATVTQAQIELFETIVESETEWLSSLQLENGAIPMTYATDGIVKMNPYFADFAALALLDRADKYAENVKKYMDWHFSHLNNSETDYNGVDGTIYDYEITLSDRTITAEISLNTYDSTDSYAATFLMVLDKYYEKTGDSDYITSHRADIARVADAMLATIHNGLTFAKPDFEVKYLMDNCEVYEGAVAATNIFEKVICVADTTYNGTLEKCKNAINGIMNTVENKLWNPVGNHYQVGIRKILNVPERVFSWNEYYPSATAQLFPIIHGLIAPNTERAQRLYNNFCNTYDWVNFDYPDAFFWGSNAYAAAVMNDVDRVTAYMTSYAELIEAHAYPLYNADAARASMASQLILDKNV